MTNEALTVDVRPYILCCVVEDVDLRQTNNLFKRFIASQTKLHDTVCQKRLASTIATHDADKIKFPLDYDVRDEKVRKKSHESYQVGCLEFVSVGLSFQYLFPT